MIKGIIFDLDGVLVFTDQFHFAAWKQLASELGYTIDEEMNSRLRGVSRMDSLNIVLEKYEGILSNEQKVVLADRKNKIYLNYLENMVPSDVSNAVRKTLADLHERGYKIALGSSSRNAKIILKKVALEEAFDAISDGTNISKSKPDPEVFLKAAEYLDLQPEECIVVEDAYAGIDAAKAGNMQAVGIGEAYSYAKADYHIKKIEELLTILP
jgi:beta-phosphoglucomutase